MNESFVYKKGKKMIPVNVEIWSSTEKKCEKHFFLPTEGQNIYLFGYNPQYISEAKANKILSIFMDDI